MIDVRDLRAEVGSFVLADVSLTVPGGGYGVVIGPAGSGKTTLLETIAGVIDARLGSIRLHGEDVTRVPPERRNLSMVYQHGYLFPHLSVADNVAYGAADPSVARALASRFGVDGLAQRSVDSLSGGERQLVALARAMATRPKVLLLDEPFAALDPRRRMLARRETRALQQEWGLTVLQVTHDFAEAGMLGDVAVLLDGGRVLQIGPPEQVFGQPASPYVAEFLGAENVFTGVAERHADGTVAFRTGALILHAVADLSDGPAHAVIRAEEITIAREPHASSARNHFQGIVNEVSVAGPLARVLVDVGGTPFVAALTARSSRELALRPEMIVHISFKATAVHLC